MPRPVTTQELYFVQKSRNADGNVLGAAPK